MTWLSDRVMSHLRGLGDTPPVTARYEIREEIGRGGMGVVYLAFDRTLEREVALKVLSTGQGADVGRRLLREAHVIGRLEHPGIVPIHDAGETDDGRPFYVMKRIRGERLDQWVTRATSLPERLRVFDRLCDTVAFAHERGIIHRDLKPENIMIGAFGEVLVIDWGIAKIQAESEVIKTAGSEPDGTRHGAIVGTPGYMAPEQARGASATADPRTDVYALGGILGRLVGGLARDEPLPGALVAIIGRAQAGEPHQRYSAVTDLADDVRQFAGGGAVAAYSEGVLERARRVIRPYRAAILLVSAYLIARLLLLLIAEA